MNQGLNNNHSMYLTANHFSDKDDSDEYYYSSLIKDQIESREYTSIIPSGMTNNSDGSNNLHSLLETLTSLEESLYSNYHSLCSNFTDYVANVETEAFKQLNVFLKTKDAKFLTFDQSIEKVLDEIYLETRLEQLIKEVAVLDSRRVSLKHESEGKGDDDNVYYSLANLTSEKKFRTPELLFLEHIFCLIKFSRLNVIMQVYKEMFVKFLEKLNCLVQASSSNLVLNVGKIFQCLFKSDWNGLLGNFKSLPPRTKWHVLKNLIYFSFKIALFQLVDLKECGNRTSMGMILNSIYQYAKSIDQI